MRHNLCSRLAVLWLVVPVMALGASACSDDDSGACSDVVNPCDTLDATSCLGNTVQTCTEDADGCLAWTDTEVCGANSTCTDGMCVCSDECAMGESQCDGDVIQVCATDADGCYYWADDTDCADTGESCDDTADAICVTGPGCGNDLVEGTEVCDGTDLDGQTCVDEGFGGGTLACNATCDGYITTGCTPAQTCGNDTIEGTEVCDGSDLNNEDCTDHGFYGGTLGCATNCGAFDTTACVGICGDDTINGTEVCDGTDLGTASCLTEGFGGGTLGCATDCTGYDTTACIAIPPGTTCASATDLSGATFPVQLTGTFDDDPATGFSCESLPTNTVWFEFTPSTSGVYTVDATNNTTTDAWATLVILDGTACGPYDAELYCDTSMAKNASGSAVMYAGSTYLIAFLTDGDTYTMVDPEIDISFVALGPGDDCTMPIDITAATFPHQETGTFDADPPTAFSCGGTPTNAIWYEYTAATSGTHVISATNATSTFAYSRLVVLDGTACAPLDAELDCVTDNSKTASTTVTFAAGSTYLIAFFTDGDAYTMVDPTITVSISYPVGWCKLQWPTTVTATEGATEMAYGRIYIAGVTDQTTGPDTDPAIIAEVGVGPDGSDPTTDFASWTWYPTIANPGFSDAANDEYMGGMTVPAAAGSPYDFAYRISGNGGISWTYCDTVDNTYTVAEAGDMISTPAPGTLIFSEYVEGSSNNKALEFFNASGINLDLGICEVRRYNNGSATPSGTYTFPSMYLAIDDTYVVCHASASATLAAYCDELNTTPVNFNGDDALELYCDGVLVDSIGQVGFDPGSFWGTAPTVTQNATLRRNAAITFGDVDSSNVFDPAAQWTGFAVDTFDGLGVHP